jgi:hypothetical protein
MPVSFQNGLNLSREQPFTGLVADPDLPGAGAVLQDQSVAGAGRAHLGESS